MPQVVNTSNAGFNNKIITWPIKNVQIQVILDLKLESYGNFYKQIQSINFVLHELESIAAFNNFVFLYVVIKI